MAKQYILALDQGTTSSRALIIDRAGAIVGLTQKELPQIFPTPGFVEHDANIIWSTQAAVMTEVFAETHLTYHDIAAIGITNQRETTVVWDRLTSKPITNAIVWQDRRTAAICKELKQKNYEMTFRNKTGLLLDPYFSGTKLKWILDHVPGAREKAEKGELAFGTIDTWIIWKLTEGRVHVTDATNASRTLLYNIYEGKWDEELLEILSIPKNLLPEVKSSSEVYGKTSEGIPISGIAGDQQAALFGQSCFEEGMGKATYGTGCFLLINTGKTPVKSEHFLTTIAYQIDKEVKYALEGSVFIGGAVVQWLRDNLRIIETSREIEALAREAGDSQGVVFVPAFTGLGASYWNPHARGMILGLSRGTETSHIALAALEGIAFQVMDIIELMKKEVAISALRVDGGAVSDDLLMQIQTDVLNFPLIRPKWKEVTALGAAFLAGLAVGFWKDLKEIQKLWQEGRAFKPTLSEAEIQKRKKNWKKAIRCAQIWGEADEN